MGQQHYAHEIGQVLTTFYEICQHRSSPHNGQILATSTHSYRLFTPRKPRYSSILNGEQGFLRMSRQSAASILFFSTYFAVWKQQQIQKITWENYTPFHCPVTQHSTIFPPAALLTRLFSQFFYSFKTMHFMLFMFLTFFPPYSVLLNTVISQS